jgi:hypothetical protein
MRLSLRAGFVFAALGLAVTAHAHDTWLRPLAAEAPVGGTLRAHLTSGMQFPVLEYAVLRPRIARADVRLAGVVTKVASFQPAKRSLTLAAPVPQAGIATLALALAPKRLTLDEAHVAEYLEEIGMTESILPIWRALPATRRWAETYRKLAKTFVRVGDPAAPDASGQEPAGLPLEIVPESDPTGLHAGDALGVRLLKDGAALPSLAIAAVHDGHRTLVTTDAEGRARFTLAGAGPWLFAATELRRRPDGEWDSDFTTMAVEVKAAR